jgi:HEAT repeat protein
MRAIAGLFTLLAVLLTGTAWQLAAQEPSPLMEQLKSPEEKQRSRAARDLGRSGDPAVVPALVEAVQDPSVNVRREVVVALASIRVPESLDGLITATRDGDSRTRVLALQGLVGYYTGHTPTIGFTGFWKRVGQRIRDRFAEESVRVDPGTDIEPRVVSALIEALNDDRFPEAQRQAADALGILNAQQGVQDLVKAAYSADERLALEALNALAKIKDRMAGPQLLNLLETTNAEVKREAAVTVGVLRTRDALPKLQALYENSPDRRLREKALEGLAYLGDPVSVQLFIKALWSGNKTLRTSAAEGLARAGERQTLAELEKAVHVERDAGVRMAMQFAITALGRDDFLSTMINELSGRRRDAAHTYLVELARDRIGVDRLYPYLNSRDAGVRRGLCTVLMHAGDATSLEHLERLTRDSNHDVATEAFRALRAVRARTATTAPAA